MINRRFLIAPALALVLTLTACSGGLLTGFRVGMRVTLPFVATLVTEGVISQAIADAVTGDINDGIDAAVNCDQCLKAIPSSVTGAAKQAAKAKCYLGLASALRSILNRHHIEGVEQLNRIARIIEAGISAFEEYARNVGPEASKARTESMSADPDKTLKDAIQKMKEDLRDATKSVDKKTGKVRYVIPNDSGFLLAK